MLNLFEHLRLLLKKHCTTLSTPKIHPFLFYRPYSNFTWQPSLKHKTEFSASNQKILELGVQYLFYVHFW